MKYTPLEDPPPAWWGGYSTRCSNCNGTITFDASDALEQHFYNGYWYAMYQCPQCLEYGRIYSDLAKKPNETRSQD